MADNVFVDANIWLYAFMDDGEKKELACGILAKKNCILSTQVINEVCVNLIKKAGYEEEDISLLVENLYRKYRIENVDKDIILKASAIRTGNQVSYWDSLIIASAINSGCKILYSEDLQHNQKIEGKLRIINPFKQ